MLYTEASPTGQGSRFSQGSMENIDDDLFPDDTPQQLGLPPCRV